MQVGRKEAEGRVEVGNEVIRLDFGPRTSDTMYNYIWVRRPDGGSWERVHNFGIDVGAYRSDTGELINTIGMNLIVTRGGSVASGGLRSPQPRGRPHRAGGHPPLPARKREAGGESQALKGTAGQDRPWHTVEERGVGQDRPWHTQGEALMLRVRYPHPLIQYRQFDDKIGTPENVAKYPDFTPAEMPGLVHAEASLEFVYEVDAERSSFVISGRVLTGKVHHVVYIIDALWTDNHALPTHEYIDGVGEFDIRTPEAVKCREVEVAGASGSPSTRCVGRTHVAGKSSAAGASRPREAALPFALFYRQDGDGVPFALLPQSPERARFCNYYDNWKCHYDFRSASLNQQFIPHEPPVTGCNDTGYIVSPREDGTLPGVRVAFFPELGWGRGGDGHQLRDRLLATIRERH
jgi:hypothetical protein